jgi:hypothetical protein
MDRRNFLRQTGLTVTTASLVGLAGCGQSGSSENESPFTVEISEPMQVSTRFFDLVVARVTLTDSPDEWPKAKVLGSTVRGFEPQIALGEEGDLEDIRVVKKQSELSGYTTDLKMMYSPDEFANDDKESDLWVIGALGQANAIRSVNVGQTATFYLSHPDPGDLKLGSVTYTDDIATLTPTTTES